MRLYHPKLGREITVPDNNRLIKVLEESGYKAAPASEPARPGTEPEPVTYEPVTPKKAPKGRSQSTPEKES